jgi:ABC-type transport system involved in multi-copper enzyme maturation permease subunit
MLWYKSWLETRWRFAIGLALVLCSASVTVLSYPMVLELLPLVPQDDVGGIFARRIREAAELVRDYRGYVWSHWFAQNLSQVWTLFAVVLGTGGLLAQATRGGALFTLSLPVSRARLLGVRAAIGLVELTALALVPSLVLVALSPAIDQSYGVGDALIHSACLLLAGSVFFSLAFLLSTVFGDVWRPLLLALAVAAALVIAEALVPGLSRFSVFRVMSAESYFAGGGVPWLGLLASVGASLAMLAAAVRNIRCRDF